MQAVGTRAKARPSIAHSNRQLTRQLIQLDAGIEGRPRFRDGTTVEGTWGLQTMWSHLRLAKPPFFEGVPRKGDV